MTEPGGSPGSGWDVRLDLGSVGTPLAGPSGNASPTGDAAGTHARRKSGDFAGTSPRADGAASGSSSSPDENVSARSNPPSPRDRSPRSRSPRPPSPSDEDDPHRAQQHSTPSPVARRSVTPLPFEQRRRDALAAKQRRLDGMMGKLSAVRTGREASPAGSVGSAESDDTHDGDDDAVDRPSPRPPNLGEPSRHPLDTEQDERLLARRASPVGSPVAKPPRADEDAVSPTLTDGSASVSDDWDDLLADARRDVFSSPPQTNPKHANAHERRVTRDVGHRVAVAHGVSRSSGTFRARASPDAKSASFRKGEGNVVVVAGEGNIFDVVAIASLPNARASHRDAVEPTVESRRREHFRNPRGRDPERERRRRRRIGEKSTRRAPTRNPRVRVRSRRRVRTRVAVRVAGDVVRDASRDGRGSDRWRFRV